MLNNILNGARTAIAILRVFSPQNWECEYLSAGCEALYGYTPSELIADQRFWQSRVFPEDWEKLMMPPFEEIIPEFTSTVEYRFLHKNKGIRWILATRTFKRDEILRCWLVTSVEVDITEGKLREQKLQEAYHQLEKQVTESTTALSEINTRLLNAITQHQQVEAALQETQTRFRQVVENINEVFWMVSYPDHEMLYISPAYETIWGLSCASLYENPHSFFDSIHPEDKPRFIMWFEDITQRTAQEIEYRIIRPDGSIRWILDRGFPVEDDNGNLYRIVGVSRDITERKQQEQKIQDLSRLYATLSQVNRAIIKTKKPESFFQVICEVAAKEGQFPLVWVGLIDYGSQKIYPCASAGPNIDYLNNINISILDIPTGQGPTGVAAREARLVICENTLEDPTMVPWREQSLKYTHYSSAAVPLKQEGQVIGVLSLYSGQVGFFTEDEQHLLQEIGDNISFALDAFQTTLEHQRAEAQIKHLAYYDSLTDLPNRRLLFDRIDIALSLAQRFGHYGAVLFVDLDQFKTLNEARGHSIGDQLLQETAKRLKICLRREDTVARSGGDEFIILLPELSNDLETAARFSLNIGEKIRTQISTPFIFGEEEVIITASIGITLFPKETETFYDLLKEADTAMYQAKYKGRDRIVLFETQMQIQVETRFALEREIRSALEQKQFLIYLQPQVNPQGQIVGGEALIRWQHPTKGLVPPSAFIPVAEETGLIVGIGEWVLQEICHYLKVLESSGSQLHLSVNVSPCQFRQPNFASQVKSIITEAGCNPSHLILEVTEGLIIEDINRTIKTISELQSLGIQFSIDDFGTGYSSLAYLKRLRVNELKIDKSFVQDAPYDPDDAALVETIISIARHFNLVIVAEGVETPEQAEFLQAQSCDFYQGYLYGRPVPLSEFKIFE